MKMRYMVVVHSAKVQVKDTSVGPDWLTAFNDSQLRNVYGCLVARTAFHNRKVILFERKNSSFNVCLEKM